MTNTWGPVFVDYLSPPFSSAFTLSFFFLIATLNYHWYVDDLQISLWTPDSSLHSLPIYTVVNLLFLRQFILNMAKASKVTSTKPCQTGSSYMFLPSKRHHHPSFPLVPLCNQSTAKSYQFSLICQIHPLLSNFTS